MTFKKLQWIHKDNKIEVKNDPDYLDVTYMPISL